MAKYAISHEGAESLRKLSNNLLNGTVALDDAGTLLERQMLALGDRLGIYEDEIFELIDKHKRTLNANSAEFVELSNKILAKAEEITTLLQL